MALPHRSIEGESPPITTELAFAFGWGAGLTLMMAAASLGAGLVPFAVISGVVISFGLPQHVAARHHGSRAPALEALIWTSAAIVAAVLLIQHANAMTSLASPGELNINTTETMRQRQESFDRWGVPPDTVASFVYVVTIVGVFVFTTTILATLAGTGLDGARHIARVIAYGLAATAALAVSVIGGLLALSILIRLVGLLAIPAAGLGAGALFGAAMRGGRRFAQG